MGFPRRQGPPPPPSHSIQFESEHTISISTTRFFSHHKQRHYSEITSKEHTDTDRDESEGILCHGRKLFVKELSGFQLDYHMEELGDGWRSGYSGIYDLGGVSPVPVQFILRMRRIWKLCWIIYGGSAASFPGHRCGGCTKSLS